MTQAGDTLAAMLRGLGGCHGFLPDDRPAADLPGWCQRASQTTDAHLVALAEAHGAKLATLDTGTPGAFIVPRLEP